MLKKKYKNILTIIIPRHINRIPEIINELEELDLKIHLHSSRDKIKNNTDIYLVDAYGKTKMFFSICNIVFLGGSLIGHGGQNPLEAARYNCQILHGPNIWNFREIYNLLRRLKVSQKITNIRQIVKKISIILNNKKKNALNRAIKDKIHIALFDDGLQDRSINYNLKFVCFNSSRGIGNGFLIPAGPLREKIQSLKKYDAVFVNGNEKNNKNLKRLCKNHNSKIEIFETYYRPTNIKNFSKHDKYLIFSGIGNPDSFKETVLENNLNISKDMRFPDHYQYNKRDINKIKYYAKNLSSKILTTEKDYLKLSKSDSKGINYLSIDLSIKNENKLIKFIKSKI
jgi:tetraacyldisaccharide 4'-kinase